MMRRDELFAWLNEWTRESHAGVHQRNASCSPYCGSAVVPQIDQGIGKRLERVVDRAQTLEAKQQASEFENHLAGLLPPPGRATELK